MNFPWYEYCVCLGCAEFIEEEMVVSQITVMVIVQIIVVVNIFH